MSNCISFYSKFGPVPSLFVFTFEESVFLFLLLFFYLLNFLTFQSSNSIVGILMGGQLKQTPQFCKAGSRSGTALRKTTGSGSALRKTTGSGCALRKTTGSTKYMRIHHSPGRDSGLKQQYKVFLYLKTQKMATLRPTCFPIASKINMSSVKNSFYKN